MTFSTVLSRSQPSTYHASVGSIRRRCKVTTTNYAKPQSYKEQIDKGIPFGQRKFYGKERQSILQVVAGMTIFLGFVAAPVLGKKLAERDSKVLSWIPWGDFTVNKHYKGITEFHTKEDIHRSLVSYQKEMHERAIRGEFTSDSNGNKKRKPLPYENDPEKRNSIYWRPNLSDGPRICDDDDNDDEDDE